MTGEEVVRKNRGFFVREAERESPLTVWILMDASASMAQQDAARPGWSLLHAAKALAACIAELALRQGDRFGLVALQREGLRLAPPGSGARQRDRLLLEMHELAAQGEFPSAERLTPLWERIAAGDLVILLSDCFDEAGIALAERLAAARREVLVIQLLTAEERDFPFKGGHRFRDPETGEELLGDGSAMRSEYLVRFGEARRALDARLDASGIRHTDYFLDQELDLPLRRLFGARDAAVAVLAVHDATLTVQRVAVREVVGLAPHDAAARRRGDSVRPPVAGHDDLLRQEVLRRRQANGRSDRLRALGQIPLSD